VVAARAILPRSASMFCACHVVRIVHQSHCQLVPTHLHSHTHSLSLSPTVTSTHLIDCNQVVSSCWRLVACIIDHIDLDHRHWCAIWRFHRSTSSLRRCLESTSKDVKQCWVFLRAAQLYCLIQVCVSDLLLLLLQMCLALVASHALTHTDKVCNVGCLWHWIVDTIQVVLQV
jgi:hypothetical protein